MISYNKYIMQNKFLIELQEIAKLLKNNWASIESPGLWQGKMEIVIFFFQYAQYTGEKQYEDYAIEIIESVQSGFNRNSPIDYENGLAGIGVCVEYLLQNGFLEVDSDWIFVDIDNFINDDIIMQKHEKKDLCGLGKYLLLRLNNSISVINELRWLINYERLIHIIDIFENETTSHPNELPEVLSFLCNVYYLNICNLKIERCLDKVLKDFSINDSQKEHIPAWTLALLRLKLTGYQMKESVDKAIDLALQVIETVELLQENREINRLLWLLQCKRLISQNGLSMSLSSRIDDLVNGIYNKIDITVFLENNELSLSDCAVAGLVIMTILEQSDGTWMDLLM